MTVRERYELKRKDMSERINLCNREDRLLVLFVERVVFLSWIIWISGRELKNTRGGSFAPLFFSNFQVFKATLGDVLALRISPTSKAT